MESQQIMELLLAMREDRKADQAKLDADRKADREMLAAIKANEEMTARMDAKIGSMHDELKSTIEEGIKDAMQSMQAALKSAIKEAKFNRKETMACQGKMGAHLEEDKPASVDTAPEVADDQEVPVEDAEVRSVTEPRKRRRDGRNLAAVHRQKKKDRVLDARCRGKEQGRAQRKNGCLKILVAARRGATHRAAGAQNRMLSTRDTTQEYCGPRKGSVAARRGTTRRVQVAQRNILSMKDTTRKDLATTSRKETRRAKVTRHKGNFVGRNRRKEIATGGSHTKDKVERGTQRMWVLERRFWTRQIGRTGPEGLRSGSYVAPQNIKCWNLWRGRPPPKRKKSRV
jgi:hypothetical protein